MYKKALISITQIDIEKKVPQHICLKIDKTKNEKKIIVAAFLDLSKSSDSKSLNFMIQKISVLGISSKSDCNISNKKDRKKSENLNQC